MTGVPSRRHRRVALLIFASTWLVYVTTAGGTMATGDGVAMFEAAKSILDRGSMDVPAHQSSEAWRGIDGRYYTPFGIGQSIYDIPFLVAGRVVVRLSGVTLGDPDTVPKAFVAIASTVSAAVAAAFGFLLAWRLSSDMRASVIAAFILAFGTLLWPYAKFGSNTALTTATLAAGVYGLAAGATDRRAGVLAAAGAALGFSLLTRHEMAIAGVAGLAWLAWQVRRERRRLQLLAAALAPVCAAVAVWIALNAVRFADPLRTGHEPAFSLQGLPGLLVSPSGALWLYAPVAIAGIVLIPLARSGHAISQLLALVSAALFVFYASLEDWLGTRSYGPRYLVPILPLLVSPIAVWISRARNGGARLALGILCTTSFLVQIPAVTVDFSRAGIEAGQPPQTLRRGEWRWAGVWVNARAVIPAARTSLGSLSSGVPVASASQASGQSLAARLPFGLDFWWVHLFQLGVLPRALALAAALLPLVGAGLLAKVAFRQASQAA